MPAKANTGWDAIIEVFELDPQTETERKRVGRLATTLNKKGVTV